MAGQQNFSFFFFSRGFLSSLLIGVMLGLVLAGCREQQEPVRADGPDKIATKAVQPPAPTPTPAPPPFEEPNLPEPDIVSGTAEEAGSDCCGGTEPVEIVPRIAIIIDDMGYHEKLGNRMIGLDMNLTFSFLPHAPFTLRQEELAYLAGRDILVHLPMEARDPAWDPGPGTLRVTDPPEILRSITRDNLMAVPHAIGANNHMGSKFTEDPSAMRQVLSVLAKHGFFFIDSYTTPKSTGMNEAKKLGLPTGRRHVFLDNIHNQKDVCRQLERLVEKARAEGWAIGIGHPNQATLQALTSCRDRLQRNVRIVGVQELLQGG
ncbi:divergent polysaccharide deacetylase family protein [Desulfolithobacter sp.]